MNKLIVVDTNVWIEGDNSDKLQKLSENGCRIYIPQAVYEEVRGISFGIKNGNANYEISSDCFKRLLEKLEEGFILTSTNGTGIVSQLKSKLETEGIEIKQPLKEGDEYESPDLNDLRILAVAIYLQQKAEWEGENSEIYLLTHDRWLAQFAVRCGVKVLGVKVVDGWAKKQKIPWKRLRGESF